MSTADLDETSSIFVLPIFDPKQAFRTKTLNELNVESKATHLIQDLVEKWFNEELDRIKWLKYTLCDEYLKAATTTIDRKSIPCQMTEFLANCLCLDQKDSSEIGWSAFANSCINVARKAAIFADRIVDELKRISRLEKCGLSDACIRSNLDKLPDWAGLLNTLSFSALSTAN